MVNTTLSPNGTLSSEFGGCQTSQIITWGRITNPNEINAVLVFTIIIHSLTCPFTIFFNLLAIVAVKCNRQLQTNSNILLACLAVTDLAVGVFVQPLYIATEILVIQGQYPGDLCVADVVLTRSFDILCSTSLFILVLISGERFLSTKYPFAYNAMVTKKRIIVAAGFMLVLVIIPHLLNMIPNQRSVVMMVFNFLRVSTIPAIILFHMTVYGQVRRHKNQILAQQVSLEVKRKITKEKKGLKTTSRILVAVSLCYFPSTIFTFLAVALRAEVSINPVWPSLFLLLTSTTALNSFINPLIYTLRNHQFRLAMIKCLFRTEIARAEEIEKRLFGSPNRVANFQQQPAEGS